MTHTNGNWTSSHKMTEDSGDPSSLEVDLSNVLPSSSYQSISSTNLEDIKKNLLLEIKKELIKDLNKENPTDWEATREKVEMVRVNFDLPRALHQDLKSYCSLNNRKVSDVLRMIILREFGSGKTMADIYRTSPKRRKKNQS